MQMAYCANSADAIMSCMLNVQGPDVHLGLLQAISSFNHSFKDYIRQRRYHLGAPKKDQAHVPDACFDDVGMYPLLELVVE